MRYPKSIWRKVRFFSCAIEVDRSFAPVSLIPLELLYLSSVLIVVIFQKKRKKRGWLWIDCLVIIRIICYAKFKLRLVNLFSREIVIERSLIPLFLIPTELLKDCSVMVILVVDFVLIGQRKRKRKIGVNFLLNEDIRKGISCYWKFRCRLVKLFSCAIVSNISFTPLSSMTLSLIEG